MRRQMRAFSTRIWHQIHFLFNSLYHLQCLGNHEFDLGVDDLVSFLNNLTVPVVSANTDVTNEPRLQGLFSKSITKSVGGETIGIVGYTTADTPFISKPGKLFL